MKFKPLARAAKTTVEIVRERHAVCIECCSPALIRCCLCEHHLCALCSGKQCPMAIKDSHRYKQEGEE